MVCGCPKVVDASVRPHSLTVPKFRPGLTTTPPGLDMIKLSNTALISRIFTCHVMHRLHELPFVIILLLWRSSCRIFFKKTQWLSICKYVYSHQEVVFQWSVLFMALNITALHFRRTKSNNVIAIDHYFSYFKSYYPTTTKNIVTAQVNDQRYRLD